MGAVVSALDRAPLAVAPPTRWHVARESAQWLTDQIRERLRALGIDPDSAAVHAAPADRAGRDRTPPRDYWFAGEIDVEVVCSDCGDWARVGSTTPRAPRCSCAALDALAAEGATASLGALADPRAARPGRCCVAGCQSPGEHWQRRSTPAGARAVRACGRHELVAERLLATLTVADAVRLATPAARRSALRRAAQARASAQRHSRASAELRGASSATHTHALLAGACEQEARAQEAFAEAVAASIDAVVVS